MYKHSNKNERKAKYLRRPIDVKTYQKPFYFLKDKWQSFRSYSTKKQIAIIGGVVGLLLLIIPIASYLYFIRDIKDPERLMNRKNTGILITDRHGEVVYSYGQTSGDEFYKLEDISDNIEQALIASEDGNFYSHSGFSIRSIAGAFVGNILNKDLTRYGGSTISQQLVKNTLLTNSKTYLRKYQELSMAIALEREYTKDEILEMYLNSVYFGEGAFGIGRAADIYFDKEPSELTLAESSVLIGLLPAPALYSPISGDPEQTKQQQERVLSKMVEQGDIKEAEIAKTLDSNIQYAAKEDEERFYAQHFVQMILGELRERYGEERVTRGGFTVQSSLDLNSQKQVEETVSRNIENIKSNDASNAALVAIDPKTNEILALVGSVDWSNKAFGQVNMTVTPRQPGSSFKPIYYAEALDKKLITNSTILKDERRTFADGYAPENYDFRFRGDVTTRYALALSLNIPAIEVMEKVGIRESAEAAERMGIEGIENPEEYGLTLALGTAEASLLDMTNAYAAFANEGQSEDASLIISIDDKYNKNIFTKKTEQKFVQSEEASHLVSSILADDKARSGLYGTALNLNNRKAAVKTGTTNDNVDAWTIGYTPNLVVGVWVGNNDHSPMRVGSGASAGPIWRDSMQSILEGTDAEEFDKPQDVIEQNVCSVNGSYKEVYITGTEPENPCHIPTQAELDAIKKKEEEERRAKEEAENEENESEETDSEEEGEGSSEEGSTGGDGSGGDGGTGGDGSGSGGTGGDGSGGTGDGSGDGSTGGDGSGGDGGTGGDGSGSGGSGT